MSRSLPADHVTGISHGAQQLWFAILVDLGAEPLHINFHEVTPCNHLGAPDVLINPRTIEHKTRRAHEELQQLKLSRRKQYFIDSTGYFSREQIHREIADAQQPRRLAGVSADDRSQSRGEFFHMKRFGKIVIRTGTKEPLI